MRIELLIYFYLAVCVAMMIFNIGTILNTHLRHWLNQRREAELRALIQADVAHVRRGETVEPEHIAGMKRKLCHAEYLLVFMQEITRWYKEDPEDIRICLNQYYSVLGTLDVHYERQSNYILYAFFLYTLKECERMTGIMPPEVAAILLRALPVPNTYCRENALQAIYQNKQPELVIQALQILDSEQIVHSEKLLTDGLVGFAGDKQELSRRLWEVFETLGQPMQEVILNYMRFSSSGDDGRMLDILTDEDRNTELRLSCIRYFARHPALEAYPVLLRMARNEDNRRWEYQAISCTALASYGGEETVQTLKDALRARNWYVRYNAAESLSRLGMNRVDLRDVMDGEDRYAREIVQYQLDMQSIQRREVPVP